MARNDNDGNDDKKRKGQKDDDGPPPRKVSHPFSHYLKLAATILVSLLIFTGALRGCAGCQDKNPVTGEPIPKPPPPPAAP